MLKKKTRRSVKEALIRTNGVRFNGASRLNGKEMPLRSHTEHALNDYFSSLNGHRPARVYDMVLREVEDWWIDHDFTDDKLSLVEQLKAVAQGLAY